MMSDRALKLVLWISFVLTVGNLFAFIILLYVASTPQVDMGDGGVPVAAFISTLVFGIIAAGLWAALDDRRDEKSQLKDLHKEVKRLKAKVKAQDLLLNPPPVASLKEPKEKEVPDDDGVGVPSAAPGDPEHHA